MSNLRITDLPSEANPSASDVVMIDGAGARKTTLAALVDAGNPVASQSEAEAGSDNSKRMTALRVKQAIAAQGGSTFATVAQGAKADSAVQPGDIGTAAAEDVGYFATAAQGSLAASAIQTLTGGVSAEIDATDPQNPVINFTGTGTGDMLASSYDPDGVGANAFDQDNMADGTTNKNYTAAEKALVASAVQPDDLATVASSGAYDDLTGRPSLGSAAAEDTTAFATAAQGTKADGAAQKANSLSDLASLPDGRKNLIVPTFVASQAAMLALDTTKDTVAYLTDSVLGGVFDWVGSDLSGSILGSSITTTGVNSTTNIFTKNNHGFYTGMAFVSLTDTADLDLNTIYYFIKVDDASFKLATSYANAVVGTAIDLTVTTNITIQQHLDPKKVRFNYPTATKSGASGAWQRRIDGPFYAEWAGASASAGRTANSEAIQAAIDACGYGGIVTFLPGASYEFNATIVVWKQVRFVGPSTKGARLTCYAALGFDTASTLTNGPLNAPIFENIVFAIRPTLTADMTLVRIRGGNSFTTFRRCRFEEPTEAQFYIRTSSVSGTFQVGETITDSNGWTARVEEVVSSSQLRVTRTDTAEFANLIAAGSTITGGTSGATAIAECLTKRYKTIGVDFQGWDTAAELESRPSVYNFFEQCEFFGLKTGVRAKYATSKKMNETVFLDCSFQFVDYAWLDSQRTSGVTFIKGGCEIWNKTAIYSNGFHVKIYGTRFERGGVATQAKYTVTFNSTNVTGGSTDTITLTGHSLKENDEIVIEGDPAKSLPTGITYDTLYYVKYVDANTIQLKSSPTGSALNLPTDASTSTTFTIRRMGNIAGQFGVNSEECSNFGAQFQIGGGPVEIVYDGIKNVDHGTVSTYLSDHTFRMASSTMYIGGTLTVAPGASVTPANNGDVTFQLTSNTSLTFKAKGSDGTVRSGSVTLS